MNQPPKDDGEEGPSSPKKIKIEPEEAENSSLFNDSLDVSPPTPLGLSPPGSPNLPALGEEHPAPPLSPPASPENEADGGYPPAPPTPPASPENDIDGARPLAPPTPPASPEINVDGLEAGDLFIINNMPGQGAAILRKHRPQYSLKGIDAGDLGADVRAYADRLANIKASNKGRVKRPNILHNRLSHSQGIYARKIQDHYEWTCVMCTPTFTPGWRFENIHNFGLTENMRSFDCPRCGNPALIISRINGCNSCCFLSDAKQGELLTGQIFQSKYGF